MKILIGFALLTCAMGQYSREWWKELGDFTRSPTEHEIVFVDQPFVVRSVEGVVTLGPHTYGPAVALLFEIEGPGAVRRVRRTETDANGRFKIPRVGLGTYKFKTTLNGFKSVAGTIIVSKKAESGSIIKIETDVGN